MIDTTQNKEATQQNNDRKVPSKFGEDLATKHGISFFETSAKDGTNVQLAFTTLAS
jgi:hypothetical protein